MLYFVILIYLILPKLNGEVFSSTAHLSNVLNTEKEIVGLLEAFIEDTEMKTMKLRRYISDFKNMEHTTTYDELVGNPLHAYQLLKHLTIDWRNVQKGINDTAWQAFVEAIQIKRENSRMPQEEDLQGAALALLRLQETYSLNASDLARGNILGFQSSVGLTARDCFYLGQHCTYHGFLNLAVEWHKLALIEAQESNSMIPEEIIPVLEEAVTANELAMAIEGLKTDSFEGLIKSRTASGVNNAKMENYRALCRGETLRTSAEESSLLCYLSSQDDYYFVLMPIKVELQSIDPLIYIFHDIIYESEIAVIKEFSKPMLERSQVVGDDGTDRQISNSRTSQNTWLLDSEQDERSRSVLEKVMNRAGWVTGFNMIGEKNSEALQVANYGIGGHYEPHHDYLFKDKTPEQLHLIDSENLDSGDRIATLMFYLSDVERGGATVFPQIGAAVWPKKGSAVFWYNLMRNGEPDPLTLHGACPVLLGSKWVGNKWIRERNQVFKRPCGLNPME